jgi:hypothetical protein
MDIEINPKAIMSENKGEIFFTRVSSMERFARMKGKLC